MKTAFSCWGSVLDYEIRIDSHRGDPFPLSDQEGRPYSGHFFPGRDSAGWRFFRNFVEGLQDIETFSHIILLYQFDRAGEIQLVRPTFLDDEPHGVFASRHPCRPNGLGSTVVKLLGRSKNILGNQRDRRPGR